jgi:hypothetical protein
MRLSLLAMPACVHLYGCVSSLCAVRIKLFFKPGFLLPWVTCAQNLAVFNRKNMFFQSKKWFNQSKKDWFNQSKKIGLINRKRLV